MEYLVIAAGLAVMVFLVWFAVRERRAGAATEQAKVAAKTVETMKAQDKAAAKAPHSAEATIDALDKGRF